MHQVSTFKSIEVICMNFYLTNTHLNANILSNNLARFKCLNKLILGIIINKWLIIIIIIINDWLRAVLTSAAQEFTVLLQTIIHKAHPPPPQL
jgi:hypothetical protein